METVTPESTIDFYHIFEIESDSNTVRKIELNDANNNDVLRFVKRLAEDAKYGQSQRQAIFNDDSSVNQSLTNCLSKTNDYSDLALIAKHLLDCEVEYNTNKGNFNPIRKGSLLISAFKNNEQTSLIIAKIDLENFFETQQLKLLTGLPQEKGMYKTCLINSNNGILEEAVYLSDKNSSISKFWWDTFLGCEFIRDAQKNTLEAFNRLSSALTHINKISPVDHAFLKGNLTSYFSTATNFDVDEMLERVVGNYAPESSEVKTSEIKTKLKNTCASGKFDTSFEINVESIKGKLKKTIRIDDDIELKIKSGDVSKIFHFEHKKSNYVAIKASHGYGSFRKLDIIND